MVDAVEADDVAHLQTGIAAQGLLDRDLGTPVGRRAPELALEQGLVGLERTAVRDDELAAQSLSSLDAFDAIHFGVRAADPGDARTQDRNQPQSRGPRRALHDALDVGNLVALHVEQEHVRRVGTQVERELLEQRRLHQPDANDEEGAKADGKIYYRHSGYPGGLTESTFRKMQATFPERVVEKAIRGMLPQNRLGRAMRSKLKVYAGPDHPHAGQAPQPFTLTSRKVETR